MFKTIIVADDLTGANDTGALLAQSGFRVGTILRDDRIDDFSDFDALCISTDSRAMSKEHAYEAVYTATKLFPYDQETVFAKRIDSTLRGNVGAEIDAILDALEDEHKAVVVASFPSSGRSCIGDILLVHGEPLQTTEVSHDPINPMTTSRVTHIVQEQTKRSVGYIGLEQVNGNFEQFCQSFNQVADTHDIIVVDARSSDDIVCIAKACSQSPYKVVAIDPGEFTNALSRCVFTQHQNGEGKSILCLVGSVSQLTRSQVAYLKKHDTPALITADVTQFLEAGKNQAEIQRVVEQVLAASAVNSLICVNTLAEGEQVTDLSQTASKLGLTKRDCSQIITNALAKIALICVSELGETLGGLYMSGGDVAAAAATYFDISGFDVKREVIPLAIYSRMIQGIAPDLPIVTKGGLIGDETTLKFCVDYLREVIG